MLFPGSILAAVEGGRWRPGIGDPTVVGWVTVAAYLVAALGCGLAAWREPMPDGTGRPRARPSRFWLALAILMLALGINKQLDLQSLATQIGRDVITARGLYSVRRELQFGFILAVALVCSSTLGGFLWAARRTLKTPVAGDRRDAFHPGVRRDPRGVVPPCRRLPGRATGRLEVELASSSWAGSRSSPLAAFRVVLGPAGQAASSRQRDDLSLPRQVRGDVEQTADTAINPRARPRCPRAGRGPPTRRSSPRSRHRRARRRSRGRGCPPRRGCP